MKLSVNNIFELIGCYGFTKSSLSVLIFGVDDCSLYTKKISVSDIPSITHKSAVSGFFSDVCLLSEVIGQVNDSSFNSGVVMGIVNDMSCIERADIVGRWVKYKRIMTPSTRATIIRMLNDRKCALVPSGGLF